MSARLTALLAALALSGCFDFDQAYGTFCDGGRCAAGGGGGSTTGGGGGSTAGGGGGSTTGGGGGSTTGGGGGSTTGGGGGSTTGGGGGTTGGGGGTTGGGGGTTGGGGGTTGGGGGTTGGGGGTTGCPTFLCPEVDWASTRSSGYYTVAAGLFAQSLQRFAVHAAFRGPGSPASWTHFEYRFTDAGVQEIPRTSQLDSRVEARELRGLSPTDYWFVYRTYATHFENGIVVEDVAGCRAADGGFVDTWLYSVAPVSADEAYFAGSIPGAICQWTRDAGVREIALAQGTWNSLYLQDLYRTPAGDLYAVGGDYTTNNALSLIFFGDGTRVSAPAYNDTYYFDGYASVGGVGNRVWALSRTGHIVERRADGGFELAYQAPFRLAKLAVTPQGEVFAAGQEPSQVVYFDGGTWSTQPLPTTEFRTEVRWENIWANESGLVLSGLEFQEDGGNRAVVNAYRRAGH